MWGSWFWSLYFIAHGIVSSAWSVWISGWEGSETSSTLPTLGKGTCTLGFSVDVLFNSYPPVGTLTSHITKNSHTWQLEAVRPKLYALIDPMIIFSFEHVQCTRALGESNSQKASDTDFLKIKNEGVILMCECAPVGREFKIQFVPEQPLSSLRAFNRFPGWNPTQM